MYIYIYINIYIYTHIYIYTYIGINMCTRTHDHAHVHTIVNMQSKFQRMCTKAYVNNHTQARISACTYICTHAYACSYSLFHIHAFSCHVTLKDLSSSYN